MGGEGGAASRTVRNDLEALVEKALLPDLLKRPPLGLDEIIVVGDIRIIHIRPETDGGGEILPHALVFPDALLAVLDERLQAVLLDLLLAVQAQHLLHFQLHRKSVGVPAGFSRNHIALHGAVARNHVLDDTGQHMADVGLSVGRGRAVVEGVGLALFSAVNTLLKNVIVGPEFLDVLLSFHKVHVCGDFFVHVCRPPFPYKVCAYAQSVCFNRECSFLEKIKKCAPGAHLRRSAAAKAAIFLCA